MMDIELTTGRYVDQYGLPRYPETTLSGEPWRNEVDEVEVVLWEEKG